MPEFDYLLFSSKSKSISSSRIHKNKENKRSYSNSLINIYALCLFAVEFYRFNETDDLDNIFYPHIGSKASDLKQVKKDMERICKECGKDALRLIANFVNLKTYIKDSDKKQDSERRNINKLLKKLSNEYYLILNLAKNLSNQVQHINDKNSYILSPNAYLQNHVKHIKHELNFSDDEKFYYLQDSALVMICLYVETNEFVWIIKKSNLDFKSLDMPMPILPENIIGYITSTEAYKEQKLYKFIQDISVLIIKDGLVEAIDKDNRTVSFINLKAEIFKLEIFKDRYISFRENDSLVIFSPRFFNGNFSQIYADITKIRNKEISYKKSLIKGLLRTLNDSSLLEPKAVYRDLKKANVFVLEKFLSVLNSLKSNLSYKSFITSQNNTSRSWLIDDIYGLYTYTHSFCEHKTPKELAKIYFEDIIKQSLNDYLNKHNYPLFAQNIDFEVL